MKMCKGRRIYYLWVKRYDPDCIITETYGQKPWSQFSMKYRPQSHALYIWWHLFTLCVFIKLSRLVHFEIDHLSTSKGNNNLSQIYGTPDDGFLTRSLPFVDTLICSDVANSIRVDLQKKFSENCKILRRYHSNPLISKQLLAYYWNHLEHFKWSREFMWPIIGVLQMGKWVYRNSIHNQSFLWGC